VPCIRLDDLFRRYDSARLEERERLREREKGREREGEGEGERVVRG
jgi:hypothetical protein